MWIDKRGEFSDSQTVTVNGVATNIVDTSSRNIGPGTPLWAVIVFDGAVSGDSPTVNVAVESSDTESGGALGTATTLVTSETVTPVQGNSIVIGFPYSNERYVGLKYTVGGTSPNMVISAHLTDQEPESWSSYPGVTS